MSLTKENTELIRQVFDLLQNHFGEDVEFVFHDLALEYEHTIVDIRNGHVTNRAVGGTGDILGLDVLGGTATADSAYNLINTTPDRRTLRSSTQFIRDSEGKICACVAINEDVTESVELERYLHTHNRMGSGEGESHLYHGDINQMLESLIDSAQRSVGKPVGQMHKGDKQAFIDYLDQRGAFLIAKSGVRVCEVLNISKFTLYRYLDIVRSSRQGGQPAPASEGEADAVTG